MNKINIFHYFSLASFCLFLGCDGDGGGTVAGKAEYDAQCTVCHGVDGTSTLMSAPINPVSACVKVNCSDEAALTAYIDQTMPPAAATGCSGACASSVANYIISGFPSTATAEQTDDFIELINSIEESVKSY